MNPPQLTPLLPQYTMSPPPPPFLSLLITNLLLLTPLLLLHTTPPPPPTMNPSLITRSITTSTESPGTLALTTPASPRRPTPSSPAPAPPSAQGCTPMLTLDVRLTACAKMEDTARLELDSCVLTELYLTRNSSDARPGIQLTVTLPPSCTL